MSHQNQIEPTEFLSPDGIQQRDAMRRRLCEEVVIAHQRRLRHRRRMTAASFIVAPVSLGLLTMWMTRGEPAGSQVSQGTTEMQSQPSLAAPRIAIVHTDETLSDRYRIDQSTAEQATDDELLDAMREIGQSAGLIRTGHRTLLVLNDSG